MKQSDLEVIAAAYVEGELRSADDELLESLQRQQQVLDIMDLDLEALSPKQAEWLDDIAERARDTID